MEHFNGLVIALCIILTIVGIMLPLSILATRPLVTGLLAELKRTNALLEKRLVLDSPPSAASSRAEPSNEAAVAAAPQAIPAPPDVKMGEKLARTLVGLGFSEQEIARRLVEKGFDPAQADQIASLNR
jgi:hypothetical protein